MSGKSFLSLPPEIRNRIYHYAFPDTTPIRLNDFAIGKKRRCPTTGCYYNNRSPTASQICGRCVYKLQMDLQSKTQQPALVRTCREIRAEALLLAYSAMTVVIDNVVWEHDLGSRYVTEMGTKLLIKRLQKGDLRRVFVGANDAGRAEGFAETLRVRGVEVKVEKPTEEEKSDIFVGQVKGGFRLRIGESKGKEFETKKTPD